MFKVFPATINHEGQKVPLIKGWNELATNDPAQLKLWSELYKDQLKFWGVPCGAVNGIVALDIDVKKINGWESLKQKGIILPETLMQSTPSGGAHVIFKTKPGVHYPNAVRAKTGLDIRGDRGWIAWYGNTNQKAILECPDWFFSLYDKPDTFSGQNNSNGSAEGATTAGPIRLAPEIAGAVFQKSIDAIREAPPGESNNVLNVESFKVGQLIASGSISKEYAFAELFKAAKDRGKPDYEAKATIESGLNGGLKHPLTSPFGSEAPKPAFAIPAVPGPPERWTPRMLTRSDLLNTSKLKKPQLFKDWSTEDIGITTADGGTGKTTLKLFEAICLALGERFLGMDNCQRGKTLYITGEDTEGKLAAMLGAIMNQMGLMFPTPENEAKIECILNSIVIKKDADLCLIAKDKQGFLFPNPDAFRKISEAIEDIKPKMIVFDPIASFWGSEAALNDMNKAVTKFMGALVEKHHVCIEMINHMGKSSSANKDMTQFAGRGGSGLPSNARVSRVLRSLTAEEYKEHTGGGDLVGDQTAMLCQVNKFSDGSSLFNRPFVIVRNGYIFSRVSVTEQKQKEIENSQSDNERVFTYVKQQRQNGRYPTRNVVIAHFMNNGDPMSEGRIKRALDSLEYTGHMGERFESIANPDVTRKDKAFIIVDAEGREV